MTMTPQPSAADARDSALFAVRDMLDAAEALVRSARDLERNGAGSTHLDLALDTICAKIAGHSLQISREIAEREYRASQIARCKPREA